MQRHDWITIGENGVLWHEVCNKVEVFIIPATTCEDPDARYGRQAEG